MKRPPASGIEAARLRDKLREYYEADGHADPIRIDLPKGSYRPQIEFLHGSDGKAESAIEAPIQATNVGDGSSEGVTWWSRRSTWKVGLAALGLLLVLGVTGAWLYRDRLPPSQQRTAEEPAAPNVPAIAVLPFTNLSGDPTQDYFSDGLTEDILTELSRARDLRVIARNTTFQYKGKAVDAGKLGRELNVRYVLEGSIQRSSDRLRVTAQLIDAATGTHIWADRYDRDLADLFLIQDEIVNQIVAKIAGSYGAIERSEAKSAARRES